MDAHSTDAAGPAINDPANLLAGYRSRPALAVAIGKDVRTLERWERLGIGPPVTRIGHTAYYNIKSFHRWLEAQEKQRDERRRRRM